MKKLGRYFKGFFFRKTVVVHARGGGYWGTWYSTFTISVPFYLAHDKILSRANRACKWKELNLEEACVDGWTLKYKW